MIILTIALVISVAVNVLLGWYISKLLQKIRTFTDGIFDIVEKLNLLGGHLETIHQLEMFYGEPVLQNLIKHLKVMVADIKIFRDSFVISEDQEKEEVVNEEKPE
jgi:K+-transporting ATPase A subunit